MAKAQIQGTLVKVILALVVIVALFTILPTFFSSAQVIAADTACTTSVWLRSNVALSYGLIREENFLPLVCPTQDIGVLEGDRHEVKTKISQMASTCWDNYAQGQVKDLFKSDRGERDCGVCYTFQISELESEDVPHENELFFVESSREPDAISLEELYNFMFFYDYNRPAVRGGNLDNYMTGIYEFQYEFNIDDVQRINTRDVTVDETNLHLNDYTGLIDDSSVQRINEVGQELLLSNRANLHIVVAETFDNINPRRARQIIENNNINTENRYDALLVMVDLEAQTILIRAGRELEVHFMEQELNGFIRKHFENRNLQNDLGVHLADLVVELKDEMMGDPEQWQSMGLRRGTYMAHLTHLGAGPLPMINDTEKDRTYVVAYIGEEGMSHLENDFNFFMNVMRGDWDNIVVNWKGYDTVEANERVAGWFNRESSTILITPMNDVLDHCNFY